MVAYIARRLLQAAGVLFLLSILFFLLVHNQPGGLCPPLSLGCVEQQHLDQPISSQYLFWLGRMVHGDFGTSPQGQPVGDLIRQELPATLLLVGLSIILQLLIAVPLGILSAVRQYSRFDQTLTAASYVALAIPAFVLGPFLLYFLALQLHWLPTGRAEDVAAPLLGSENWWTMLRHDPGFILGDLIRHLALPLTVLTFAGVAIDSRIMRTTMLQVLGQEYIRTARAKGVSQAAIVLKHAFRNALPPVVTNIGLYLPALIAGDIVVERVFSWGGLGSEFVAAMGNSTAGNLLTNPNYPFLEALLMLSATLVVLANLAADIASAWLDPRMRLDDQGRA